MGERAYTLSEIDKMREVLRNKLRPPPLNLPAGSYLGDPWGDHQKRIAASMAEAEEQLRTFMIANGDPSELLTNWESDTDHLLRNPENAKRLKESIKQADDGEFVDG